MSAGLSPTYAPSLKGGKHLVYLTNTPASSGQSESSLIRHGEHLFISFQTIKLAYKCTRHNKPALPMSQIFTEIFFHLTTIAVA